LQIDEKYEHYYLQIESAANHHWIQQIVTDYVLQLHIITKYLMTCGLENLTDV